MSDKVAATYHPYANYEEWKAAQDDKDDYEEPWQGGDPECKHVVEENWSGIRCKNGCGAWSCY